MTPAFLRSLFDANTDVVPLLLLTLSHPSMENPARLVLNDEDIESRGQLFHAAYLSAPPPLDSGDEVGSVQFKVDNVDRDIVVTLRGLDSPPTVLMEVVSSLDLDSVEIAPGELELQDAEYTTLEITGTLGYEDILNLGFPHGSYTPNIFPGLFA